jgi:hypothetical protein
VLPFDAELRIEIDPVPRDLAGLAAESIPTTVRTMRDPGLFAEDGFSDVDMALPAGTSGELIFDIYQLPLYVPPCPSTAIFMDDLRVE